MSDRSVVHRQAERAGFAALVPAMRAVDPSLPGHSVRVAALSVRLGRGLGLTAAQLDTLALGALLHDVGKLALPAAILQAPRRLLADEVAVVQRHPLRGADWLRARGFDEPVVALALHHHERMDGSGYPGHLLAPDIRLSVRICAVADVWDALVSPRPYKRGLPVETSAGVLRDMAGGHLDPEVVTAFFDLGLDAASPLRLAG